LPFSNLGCVFVETGPKRSFTFSGSLRRLPDINQFTLEIKCIDSTGCRTDSFLQRQQWAVFEPFDYLSTNTSIEIKVKVVRIAVVLGHHFPIVTENLLTKKGKINQVPKIIMFFYGIKNGIFLLIIDKYSCRIFFNPLIRVG